MPTTEVLVCPLIAGADIGDPSNQAAIVLKEVGNQLSKTGGVASVHFGSWVEAPGTLQLLVNWDRIESHKAFMATEVYKPFLNRFLTIAGGSPTIVHADLKPEGDLTRALSAPVTEVATFYFGGEAPSDYMDGVLKFRDILNKEQSDGFLGSAAGVTYEDDMERDGVKGKAAVLIIGWESVEKHMKFREGSTFKENLGLLRNGAQKIEMHHVAFLNFLGDA